MPRYPPLARPHPVVGMARRLPLLGVAVDAISLEGTVAEIGGWIASAHAGRDLGAHGDVAVDAEPAQARHVVTLNPELVMAARGDPTLRSIVLAADMITADGVGIVLAAQARGVRLPGRVPGVDLLEALAAGAAARGWRLFLLGAMPGVAEAAAVALEERYAGLRLAGTFAGTSAPEGDAVALAGIQAARADLVFVAFGAPAQERWIARNRGHLTAVAAIGVGGAFDFVAGCVPRAPTWMRHVGLEWLFRLLRQPWRWRRMLVLPHFAGLALVDAFRPSRVR